MTKDFEVLYIGTGIMLILCISLILFVVWATITINRQQKFLETKEKYWMQRIEGVEALVKTEFQAVLTELKKL